LADGRNKNNLTQAQRRAAAHANLRRKPSRRRLSALEAAKNVLRRSGREVYDARIDEPGAAGMVRVDTRKLPPEAVIELAAQILEREKVRNDELRRQHGLAPATRRKR
jgi:hypothetical protein